MKEYRIFGYRTQGFYTVLKAKDNYDAYEQATKLTTDKWSELELDNIIEVGEVYEDN